MARNFASASSAVWAVRLRSPRNRGFRFVRAVRGIRGSAGAGWERRAYLQAPASARVPPIKRKRVTQVGSGAYSIYLPKRWIDGWPPEQREKREVDLHQINQSL